MQYGQQVSSGIFIPNSPHSHGEMDHLKGPDVSVDWNDAHFHSHAGFSISNYTFVAKKSLC